MKICFEMRIMITQPFPHEILPPTKKKNIKKLISKNKQENKSIVAISLYYEIAGVKNICLSGLCALQSASQFTQI